jgi:hypothetical protein
MTRDYASLVDVRTAQLLNWAALSEALQQADFPLTELVAVEGRLKALGVIHDLRALVHRHHTEAQVLG